MHKKILKTHLLIALIVVAAISCWPAIVARADTGGTLPGPSAGGGLLPGPSSSSAPQGTFTLSNPLKVNSIGGLIQNFVEIFSYIVILLAVLALIYVGFMYVMSQGKPEKRKDLNTWLLYIVIGVAVVISARLIVNIVINTLSATGTVSPGVIQSVRNAASGN